MTFLFRLVLFVIGAASLLPYFPTFPPYRWLWMLELVVTELSPYLFVLLSLSYLFTRRLRTRLACGLVAFMVATPLMIATSQERNWIWDMEYGMGRSELPEPAKRSPYIGDIGEPLWGWKGFFKRTPPANPEVLSYKTKDGATGKLLRYPSKSSPIPASGRPWVVVIHGGGWNGGEPDQIEWINYYLNEAGYEVFAPSYRFTPKHLWPTQSEDIRAAIASIQTRSKEFQVDPKKFVLLGRSAGGQIALKIAYAKDRPEGVRGVISFYAPTDLEFGYRWSLPHDVLDSKVLMEQLTGGSPDSVPHVYKDASPLNDVSSDDPRTLLIYGRPDPLVWYRHGERLERKLRANGVPVARIELPWATHGFDYFSSGLGGQIGTSLVLRFLRDVR